MKEFINTPYIVRVEDLQRMLPENYQVKNDEEEALILPKKLFHKSFTEEQTAQYLRATNTSKRDDDESMRDIVMKYCSMCFDKLKMIYAYNGNHKPFLVLNPEEFEEHVINQTQVYYEHRQTDINLYIRYGINSTYKNYNELIIGFNSSILQERMMELINSYNIKDCLQMLDTEYHLIRIFDIDDFINNAYVYLCDVTKDQFIPEDLATSFRSYTYNNRTNTRKTKMTIYERANFDIQDKEKEKLKGDSKIRTKIRLTFYSKYQQWQDKRNKRNRLPSSIDIEKYKDLYRLELNLKSPQQIMQYLNIKSNRLYDVLHSDAQPIYECYRKWVKLSNEIQSFTMDTYPQYKEYAVAKINHFNIEKIEEALRELIIPWRTKIMEPYKQICSKHDTLTRKANTLTQKIIKLLTIKYEETRKISNLMN